MTAGDDDSTIMLKTVFRIWNRMDPGYFADPDFKTRIRPLTNQWDVIDVFD